MTRGRSLLLTVWLAGASCTPMPSSPQQVGLRLVSWNIRHGEGLDHRVDVDRIARELASLAPDVVCLQEVDVGVTRSQRLDLPNELAQRLGMFAAFGKNIDHQGGDYGNAILSRWPIAWQQNLHYRMLRKGEQRGLLQVGIATEAGTIGIGTTHLDFRPDPSERLINADELLAAVRERPLALVAGDFNDRPGSTLHQRLCAELTDCWAAVGSGQGTSFPADTPDRRIDWVLAATGTTATAAQVVATDASDHRAVVVDVTVRLAASASAQR